MIKAAPAPKEAASNVGLSDDFSTGITLLFASIPCHFR